jgi:hypothetical protein
MFSVCCPVLVSAVTACPDAPVSLMAAAEPADCPAGVTKTSKEVPEAGVAEHWKAQPMFQLGAVIVKSGLVQFPDDCIGPTSTRATAVVVVVVVDPVDDEVLVVVDDPAPDDPDVVVVVEEPPAELPAAVVVVLPDEPGAVVPVELAGGGGVYVPAPAPDFPDPAAVPPEALQVMAIPINAAITMPTTSCHVAHERRSLRPSCPGAGTGSKPSGSTGVPFTISSPRRPPLSAPSPNRGRNFDARQDDAPL